MATVCTDPATAAMDELYSTIIETFARGGNVVIPTFALERAQEILFLSQSRGAANKLPPSIQVYLDSPMAISATEIFSHHPECLKSEAAALFQDGQDPFHLPGLHFTRETADSMAINKIRSGAVIMAGAGMVYGRPHPSPYETQSVAAGVQRCLRRLRRTGHAGAPDHGRSKVHTHLRR